MRTDNASSPWYTRAERKTPARLLTLGAPMDFRNDAEMVDHARSDIAELQRPGEFLEPEDVIVSVRLRRKHMLRLLDLADIGAVEEPTERASDG